MCDASTRSNPIALGGVCPHLVLNLAHHSPPPPHSVRHGPRPIDLDILAYDTDSPIHESDDLTVPHIGIPEREFVLKPLADRLL